MTIQILLKIGAVGILVALLNQILKHSGKEEHAYLLNLAGLIIVLSWVIPYISDLFSEIMELVDIGREVQYESHRRGVLGCGGGADSTQGEGT